MYIESNIKSECTGCGACVKVCPTACLSMERDDEGFLYPVKDNEKCTGCNQCLRVCPVVKQTTGEVISTYAGTGKNTETVKRSSSGGIYPLIANMFLDNGGVVYAVELGDSLKVRYKRVTDKQGIAKTQGSKYVQCDMEQEIFALIEQDLKQGKKVCLVGTPCLVQAVKNIFHDTNLFTVDFICEGVPSPILLAQYVRHLEKKHRGKVVDMNFRNKDKYGWSIMLSYDIAKRGTVKRYYLTHKMSGYFTGYLHGLTQRESCYNCRFSHAQRSSDITLSDFWGCKTLAPELLHRDGVSLVLANTEKGKALMDSMVESHNAMLKKIDIDIALLQKYNPNLAGNISRKPTRDTIYVDLEKYGFSYIDKHYFKPLVSTKERIIAHIPDSLKKVVKKIRK